MAYGTLKADSLVYDDGGSDSTPVTISSLGAKADLGSPDFTTDITLKAQAPVKFEDDTGGEYVGLKAPTGVTTYTVSLPATEPAEGKVLKATSTTALEWGDVDLDALAPKANPIFTGHISFEGSEVDDFETGLAVVNPTADRTITLPDATGTVPLLQSSQNWTGSQRGTTHGIGTVSSGDAVIPLDSGNHFTLTVGGTCNIKFMKNTTPDAITSTEVGQTGTILVTNSGSHVPTWENTTYFAGGLSSAPTITASADTLLTYTVIATNKIVVAGLSEIGNA